MGLSCRCHPADDDGTRKRNRCPHSGRKFPQAYEYLCKAIAKSKKKSVELKAAECEGDEELAANTRWIRGYGADQLELKTGYLKPGSPLKWFSFKRQHPPNIIGINI